VDRAYDEARQFDAQIATEAAQNLPQRMAQAVEDTDIDAQLTPAATRTLEMVQEAVGEGAEPDGPTIRVLENMRRKINNNVNSAANRTDRRAVTRMKQAFDETIDDAIDQRLYSGDPRAVEKLKEARALRREYTKQFGDPESKDRVDKIIGKITQDNPDPSEVIGYTFGWGQLGNKGESAKVLKRLRDSLGSDSPEWDQMREAGFFQLVRNAAGDAQSPKQMQKALKKAYNRNKELLDTLYSPEEQRTIKQFVDTANLTQALPEELGNPSQTAFALRDMMRTVASYGQSSARIHGNFGTGTLFATIKRLIPMGKTAREARATTRPMPIPQPRAPSVTAAGASIGAQNEEELNRQVRGLLDESYRLGKRGLRGGRSLLME
jgi:hypothetical protein